MKHTNKPMKRLSLYLFLIISLLFTNITFAECIGDDCEEKQFLKELPGSAFSTPGFDFICYNSCKDRNDESFCIKQCALQN